MKNRLLKILVLVILVCFPLVGITNSFYVDRESLTGNLFEASTLDFSLSGSGFNAIEMAPGDSEIETAQVNKDGLLGFKYDLVVVKTGGDDGLCNSLQLEADLDGVNQYTNGLMEFTSGPHTYTGPNEEWEFTITFPGGDPALQDKECEFNFVFNVWQTDSDGTWGFRDEEILGNYISSEDWTDPESEITDLTGSGSLGPNTNLSEFNVHYWADDPGGEISKVQLWYSYNLETWQLFDEPDNSSNGFFLFDKPQGDGTYRFLTVVIDSFGNVEDKDEDGYDDNYDDLALEDAYSVSNMHNIMVDTEAPYTNLSLGEFGEDRMAVNEQLVNGNFEDDEPERGWVMEGDGEHTTVTNDDLPVWASVKRGERSGLVGWLDEIPNDDEQDYIYQVTAVPSDKSTLSFWYRVLSDDIIEYDWFEAKIVNDSEPLYEETIIRTNNWDSGWKEITHPLSDWLDTTIRVWFGVSNHDLPGEILSTFALVDDVRVTNSDNNLSGDQNVDLESEDAGGSGFYKTYYSIKGTTYTTYSTPEGLEGELDEGENEISYYSEDVAGNVEDEKTLVVNKNDDKDYLGIVLNAFMPDPSGDAADSPCPDPDDEWIELYNLSNSLKDVNGWYMRDVYKTDGSESSDSSNKALFNTDKSIDNTTEVLGDNSLIFCGSFNLNNEDEANGDGKIDGVEVYNDSDELVDSYIYTHAEEGKEWAREPDGTGTWADPEPDPDPEPEEITAEIRNGVENEIKLVIKNLSDNYGQEELIGYEITYMTDNGKKGIAGKILVDEVENNQVVKEIYLGSCSAKGSCTPDEVKPPQVTLTLTQGSTAIISEQVFEI